VIEEENGFSHFQSEYHLLSPRVEFDCSGGLCIDLCHVKRKSGTSNDGRSGSFWRTESGGVTASTADDATCRVVEENMNNAVRATAVMKTNVVKRRGGMAG
jgi:hypothetical protein